MRERLRYKFDNILGRGTSGMVVLLFSFALVFLVAVALIISILRIRANDDQTLSFREAFWQSMLRAMDAGTISGDNPWPFRITSLVITIMGIFVVSALIGILASGLDSRLAALQRGRGRIAVAGHTLILGWSPKVITILGQLAIAKASERSPTVVILADRDKQEIDDLIEARLPAAARHGLTIVTRTGQADEPTDVAIVNPELASSIIVLSDDAGGGDAGVIKTVLGLLGQTGIDTSIPVVAEISSPARAQALRSVTTSQVAVVEPGEIVARAAAQSSRETGLNLVLQDLFDFEGCEIYFTAQPHATGMLFGEVLNCFESAAVIGVKTLDGEMLLNPPADRPIAVDEKLIVIAEDDSTIAWTGTREAEQLHPAILPSSMQDRASEALVVFGWNAYGRAIVSQLDEYVPAGSRLTLVIDPELVDPALVGLPNGLVNLSITVREIHDSDDPVGTVLADTACDNVLILCYRAEVISPAEAESRVLTTFLEVRTMLERLDRQANVTAELLDERNVALIPSATAGEFMVSEKIASLIIAQLSQNIGLQALYDQLLDPAGSEIYCKPVERYCTLGQEVRFADLVATASAQGEAAIGWRVAALGNDRAQGFGVFVNPAKSATVTFAPGDQLVVVAEEDA